MTPRAFVRTGVAASLAILIFSPHSRVSLRAQSPQNYIQIENAKQGTTEWKLDNPGWTSGVIEAYADVTSVNRGGQIKFYVSTDDPSFTIQIFRIGYYGGAGGRKMTDPVTLSGIKQTIPSPDPDTGLIECNWINPYVLTIPDNPADPTDWMSGFYYAKLTSLPQRKQWYVTFVVRDDARRSDLLLAQAVTTAEAYNPWGGKSLYGTLDDRSDTANASRKTSFHRPYYGEETWGAGQFSNQNDFKFWEWGMVQFLESNGYDVTYATNIDVHRDSTLLLNHKAFLSVGHDEYWSWAMRDNVENARDAGVNLGFFSANTSYWQVRFEPSPTTGEPDTVMVGYKDYCKLDPTPAPNLRTCRFRDPRVNRSEDRMLGIMMITQSRQPFIVEDASHWLFTGTGLKNGDSLTNPDGSYFVGYEVDAVGPNSPPNLERAAHSPATPAHANFSDMTVYRSPKSGATVFASGSILWTYTVPQIVTVTRNVLARLINNDFADTTPVRPQLPAPFQATDIGDVGRAGFVSLADATSFTLNGAGQNEFNGADALFYAYQGLTGDGTIKARITGVQQYWDNRAGLMIRESLAPDARYVSVVSRPSESHMNGTSGVNEGVEFRSKPATGGRPATIAQQDLPMPNWVKLHRSGNDFTASISADGVNWTVLGTTNVPMAPSVFIGASVASAQHAVWVTASYDHVSVIQGSDDDDGSCTSSSLPAGWSDQDVGAVGVTGTASYGCPTASSFTVTGAGADIWNTADAFHYTYTTLTGDGAIVADVSRISSGQAWIKAGVMLRDTLDPSSAHGLMLVSYGKGVAFQRRTATGGVSTSTSVGSITAPRWVRLDRRGSTFTASQSSDGVSWTVVGTDTIAMGPQIYAGLAVSSHTASATATATFDNVSVTPAPPNQPPQVGITAPASNATVSDTVSVTASASDDVQVLGVQFTLDGANLGAEITAAPYTVAWDTRGVENGSHTLTAIARDARTSTTSAPVTVTVNNPPQSGTLPPGWLHGDVGSVGPPGDATYDAQTATFSVTGAGSDVWGTADAFHYAYTMLNGDGAIVAEVRTVSAGAPWVKAGVMLRDTLDPSSAQAFMLVSYAKGSAFQRRTGAGGISTSTGGGGNVAPWWVKLARKGNTITASQSADGRTWTDVGTDTIPMGSQILAGLAVSSHTTTATATATFDNVSIGSSPPPQDAPPSVSIATPGQGATVNGTMTVSANAADDYGVSGVQFRLDGANLGSEIPTAPYTASWNTTTAANGPHTLTAVARDTSGQTTTSSPVTVTVNNQANQAQGDQCSSVTLSQTTFYSGGPASNWRVTVTAPTSTCTWTATVDQPWLLLNDVPGPVTISGTGSGVITVSTTDNGTGAFRFGTFTIAGTSYTVTQESL